MKLSEIVDVTPVAERRIRTLQGDLLPEGHILRGETRSPYWLRLERDGDVVLTPHEPESEAAPQPATELPSRKIRAPEVAEAKPVTAAL